MVEVNGVEGSRDGRRGGGGFLRRSLPNEVHVAAHPAFDSSYSSFSHSFFPMLCSISTNTALPLTQKKNLAPALPPKHTYHTIRPIRLKDQTN